MTIFTPLLWVPSPDLCCAEFGSLVPPAVVGTVGTGTSHWRLLGEFRGCRGRNGGGGARQLSEFPLRLSSI